MKKTMIFKALMALIVIMLGANFNAEAQIGKNLLDNEPETVKSLEIFGEHMEKGKRKVRILKPLQAYHAYGDMIVCARFNKLVGQIQFVEPVSLSAAAKQPTDSASTVNAKSIATTLATGATSYRERKIFGRIEGVDSIGGRKLVDARPLPGFCLYKKQPRTCNA